MKDVLLKYNLIWIRHWFLLIETSWKKTILKRVFLNEYPTDSQRIFLNHVIQEITENNSIISKQNSWIYRSSHPKVFLRKGVLKICRNFTGEHPCRSAISIKLQSNFIEIILLHGCFPVYLLHIFRTPFTKNTFGWLLLDMVVFQ